MNDMSSIVLYKISLNDIDKLIDIGKEMKSNIIVYLKSRKTVIGFSQNAIDANILKVFEQPPILELSEDFPNIAIMNKDLIALQKLAKSGKFGNLDIYGLKTRYNGINDQIVDIWCLDEHKLCYDHKDYEKIYDHIIMEMSSLTKIASYTDIRSILEFNKALSSKAADGIQKVYYDSRMLFIAPTFINAKKNEKVDIDLYEDQYNNYLINIIIHKKRSRFFNIYRILKL